jgi:GNAT superfamily N-acetyltransferase
VQACNGTTAAAAARLAHHRATQQTRRRLLLPPLHSSSYSIRAITAADIPVLARIEQQCGEFSACWSAADIAAELDNTALSRAAVAADAASDEALGYIVCWLVAGELQVLECAVDPAHQSQGIGTALLQHMLHAHRWVRWLACCVVLWSVLISQQGRHTESASAACAVTRRALRWRSRRTTSEPSGSMSG